MQSDLFGGETIPPPNPTMIARTYEGSTADKVISSLKKRVPNIQENMSATAWNELVNHVGIVESVGRVSREEK